MKERAPYWGLTESWFDYIEEKFCFPLNYIAEERLLSIQLATYVIKNIKFHFINVTEKILPKEY